VHNAYASKLLGTAISAGSAAPKKFAAAMRRLGYQAGHIVPVGKFTKRSAEVQKAIADSQAALARAGISLNKSWQNGFWAKTGHLGSHKDSYLLAMGNRLRGLTSKADVERGLLDLKNMLQNGVFK